MHLIILQACNASVDSDAFHTCRFQTRVSNEVFARCGGGWRCTVRCTRSACGCSAGCECAHQGTPSNSASYQIEAETIHGHLVVGSMLSQKLPRRLLGPGSEVAAKGPRNSVKQHGRMPVFQRSGYFAFGGRSHVYVLPHVSSCFAARCLQLLSLREEGACCRVACTWLKTMFW